MPESSSNLAEAFADFMKGCAEVAAEQGMEPKAANAKIVRERDGKVVEETDIKVDAQGSVTISKP